MQTNILWTGIEYYSLENCLLKYTDKGAEISSAIIGMYENKIYKIEYLLKTNQYWETIFFELKSQLPDKRNEYTYQSDGKGNWTKDGTSADEFKGCMDIDIPLSPFTNSLPINRMKLSVNEGRRTKVLYFDILNQEIKALEQYYKRLSPTEYKYENVPNDFEATIVVDELGLVVNYPGLFERKCRIESKIPEL